VEELRIFKYRENPVRMIEMNGEPWWVLKDVCDVLGIKNPTMVADRLDEDERAKFVIGRQGETNIVNEPGLYKVLLRSDKPEAKSFSRWVTHEVLPTIRKHGGYWMKPANIRDAVRLIQITRETMLEQGHGPAAVARGLKEMGAQFGIEFPNHFIRPDETDLEDVNGWIEYIYSRPSGKGNPTPTYDDCVVYQVTVRRLKEARKAERTV
jgi:prophage antirepressor-like protein